MEIFQINRSTRVLQCSRQTNFKYLFIFSFEFKFRINLKQIWKNTIIFYTLLFHSLFKVKFNIAQIVLGEHREH